jgi:transposase
LLEESHEYYILVESEARVDKERSMRRRKLKRLWATLKELKARKKIGRDELLMQLGAARKEAGRQWGLVRVHTPAPGAEVNGETFRFELDREKLRRARSREGRYLLRSNIKGGTPETVWESYLLLTRVEQAFKDLKSDLSLRPIFHQKDKRIEAHVFVCFLAYALHTTLRNLARGSATGLTSDAILKKLAAIEMVDVHLPTTDGRLIVLTRYTQPEADVLALLDQLKLSLPAQPPPRVYASGRIGL